MKIASYLLIFNLFLFTCEPPIEYNKRLVVEGNLLNSEEESLPNIQVYSFIVGSVYNSKLGEDYSDDQGNFHFVSFESFEGEFSIFINPNSSEYSSAIISRVTPDNILTINNEVFSLGTIELKPVSFLQLNINKTSNENHQLSWRLEYFSSECNYDYDFTSLTPIENECFAIKTFNDISILDETNFSDRVKTLQNTTATFIYQLDNEPEVTIEIPINQNQVEYEFTY